MTATTSANAPALNMQGEAAEATIVALQTMDKKARQIAHLRSIGIQPGTTRNPRGRPKKDLDLAKLAQKHAQKAIETLARCLDDDTATWPARVSAARELLDRGFGRAPQSLNVDHKVDFSANFEAFVRELGDRRAGRLPAVGIEHDDEE